MIQSSTRVSRIGSSEVVAVVTGCYLLWMLVGFVYRSLGESKPKAETPVAAKAA